MSVTDEVYDLLKDRAELRGDETAVNVVEALQGAEGEMWGAAVVAAVLEALGDSLGVSLV